MNYASIVCRRNSCVEENISGAMTVVSVIFNVIDAGQVLAILKIHLRKIRGLHSPALRYGTSSHVFVSLPLPGDKATLAMSDGDVMLLPSMPGDDAPGQRTVHFTFPSSRFLRLVNLWGPPCILWVVAQIGMTAMDASILRAKPLERCWETRPAYKAQGILAAFTTALAGTLLIAMFALLASHGLGRVVGAWIRYWYRRNWVLVAASILRGFAFMRQEFPVSAWISSFLNNSVFLCVALSAFDVIALITQSAILKVLYRLYILSSLFAAFLPQQPVRQVRAFALVHHHQDPVQCPPFPLPLLPPGPHQSQGL
jgi:hypothetical protein